MAKMKGKKHKIRDSKEKCIETMMKFFAFTANVNLPLRLNFFDKYQQKHYTLSAMKFFKNIADKIKNTATKASDALPHSDLSVIVESPHIFSKTSKDISGILTCKAERDITIKKITYEIREDVDPIIGKDKNEADVLGTKTSKKKIDIIKDEHQEIAFSLPIFFANEHKEEKIGGDMELLNQMSERSKKTAINYDLIIKLHYLVADSDTMEIKTIKHGVNFE